MREHFHKNIPHPNETEQLQQVESLSNIDTKLSNIDNKTTDLKTFTYQTDPSEPLTSGQTIQRNFCIIGGVDQVNSNFDEINPLQVDANGKITISNIALAQATQTPADTTYKQKVFLGLHDVSNSVIRTAQSDPSGNLKVANDKITQGSDATLSTAQQVLIYGLDNQNLSAIKVNTQGALKVIQDSVEVLGSQNNLADNITLNFGTETNSLDITDYDHANIFIEDASITVFDSYEMLVSVNDTDYYLYDTPYPTVRNSKREAVLKNLNLHGIKYVKFKNASTTDNYTNVKITVVGTVN